MIVEALIPWGGTASERSERRHGLTIVLAYWREMIQWALPFDVTFTLADEAEPFRKGAAVNLAAARSQADVLFVNDADSIVQPDQLIRAVAVCELSKGFVHAYDLYQRLGAADSAACVDWRDVFKPDADWEQPNAPSHGCFAAWRQSFLDAGGYDPRFIYWYDDMSFETFAVDHPWDRVPGILRHVWHPSRDVPAGDEELWARYKREDPKTVRAEAGFPL